MTLPPLPQGVQPEPAWPEDRLEDIKALVYCVPDGVGKFSHHAKRVPMADQEVLYRSLRYMPSELRAAQERAGELSASIAGSGSEGR